MFIDTETMNKMHELQYEMLKELIRVMDELNVRYYFVHGSLLGAIREHDFILEDDDIDIAVPRKDYNLLMSEGNKLLPGHLFLQNSVNDDFPLAFGKLRNSDTAFIQPVLDNYNCNQGMYIDIFPIDYSPTRPFWREKKIKLMSLRINSKIERGNSLKHKLVNLAAKILYPSLERTMQRREKLLSSQKETHQVSIYGGKPTELRMPSEWFGRGKAVRFVDINVNCPDNTEEYLTRIYGKDYINHNPAHDRISNDLKVEISARKISFDKSYRDFISETQTDPASGEKPKKNILFLTGRYLPNMSANGVCINNIIRTLPPDDYKVSCICYDDGEKTAGDNVRIIRVSRGLLKSLMYKTEKKSGKLNAVFGKAIALANKIKDIPFLLSWPWNDPIFTNRVFRKAEKLHKKNPFDYVVAVHMPLSSLIAANKLKKKYPEVRFIPYFLDSLSAGRPISYMSEEWNRKKKLNWERKLLPAADKIVVMEASRAHHEKYSAQAEYYDKFVYLDVPLLCVQNNTDAPNPFGEEQKIQVTFGGAALHPMRNMQFFIKLADKIHSIDDRIVFNIIGQCNCQDRFDPEIIRYHQPLPHDQLIPYLAHSDVLLNFGVRVPAAISGKIFEYMSFGKPIISTYGIQDEACIPYLKKYPRALLIEENEDVPDQTAQEAAEFIRCSIGCQADTETIKTTYRNNLAETFIQEIFDE